MSMKKIGNVYYVHKSNIQELLDILPSDEYKRRIIRLCKIREKSFTLVPYEVIKYDVKQHKLSLIDSPDWNTANEPTQGDYTYWNFDKGTTAFVHGGNTVYHSKELFVSDDYTGFNIQEAKERTKLWQSLVSTEEKKLIGNKKYWNAWCIEHGIDV